RADRGQAEARGALPHRQGASRSGEPDGRSGGMRAGRLLLLSLLGSIGMAGPARASDADEVPAFLRRPIRTVEEAEETAPADSEEDPLRELMKRVRVGGEESEGSFFSIQTGDESIQTGDEDPAEDEAPREIAQEEE